MHARSLMHACKHSFIHLVIYISIHPLILNSIGDQQTCKMRSTAATSWAISHLGYLLQVYVYTSTSEYAIATLTARKWLLSQACGKWSGLERRGEC